MKAIEFSRGHGKSNWHLTLQLSLYWHYSQRNLNSHLFLRILSLKTDIRNSTWGPVRTFQDIFENTSFLSVLGWRPHLYSVFRLHKRSFWRRPREWIFLKTPFSWYHVDGWKRSLTKMQHHRFTKYQSIRSGLWGSHEGSLLVCFLLSKL